MRMETLLTEEIQDGLTIFQNEMFKTRSESREEAAETYHVRKHTDREAK